MQKAAAFKDALSGARANLKQAGELLVEMLDENEDTMEILLRENRGLSIAFLESLERVGRGLLDPLLLTDTAPAAQRAISQALPPQAQKELLTKNVPVVVGSNGETHVEHKPMRELNTREAARVIGDGKIRTPEEQLRVLQEQAAARVAKSVRYEIRGDRVLFHEGAMFTWVQLEEIIEKIRPKPVDIEAEIKRRQVGG